MSAWVVVGSGPSARSALLAAQHDHGRSEEVVTCNGGYQLFDAGWPGPPTRYLLVDPIGCRTYGDKARALRTATGTRIVSIRGRMADADEYLRLERGPPSDEYRFGHHPPRRLTGLYMLDYALSHGADTVLIIGFDGYQSRGASRTVDYFDGRVGHGSSWLHNTRIATYLAGAVSRRSSVDFTLYADPSYPIPEAMNFRLVRTVA